MRKTTVLAGQGISSGRPFSILITEVYDTIWLKAQHQSGVATATISFPRTRFCAWLLEPDLSSEPASITGMRSRGGKSVQVLRLRSGHQVILTLVDQSGKITNTTLLTSYQWDRFSKSMSSEPATIQVSKPA